jgi:hypothetical protein
MKIKICSNEWKNLVVKDAVPGKTLFEQGGEISIGELERLVSDFNTPNAKNTAIVEKILNAGTSIKIDSLFEGSNCNTFIECINSLKSRDFIQVHEDEAHLNFKTKYV